MNEKYLVRCVLTNNISYGDETLTVYEGREYTVRPHPSDNSMWYVIFPGNKWVLVGKWLFAHKVVSYLVHGGSYPNVQQPIIGEDNNVFLALTPTGFVSVYHKDNIVVGKYPRPWYIDSSEVRFRFP